MSKKSLKSSNENTPDLAAIKVEYHSYTDVTREADPNEEYDGDDTSTSHTVVSATLVEDNSFNCVGNFSAQNQNKVYIVYAVYSTADSFSRHDGSGIEFVQAFISEEKAVRCMNQIKANNNLYNELSASYRNDPKKIEEYKQEVVGLNINKKGKIKTEDLYSVNFQDEKDEIRTISAPWNGYFESLDYVEVATLPLNFEHKRKYKI